jgi:PPM family protein phosphatase
MPGIACPTPGSADQPGSFNGIVLCSDGLFNELSDEEIGSALAGDEDVAGIVEKLIDGAIAGGGRDNVSIVVAEVAA